LKWRWREFAIYNLKGTKVAYLPQRFHTKGEHNFSIKIPKGFYVVEAKMHDGTREVKFTEKLIVR